MIHDILYQGFPLGLTSWEQIESPWVATLTIFHWHGKFKNIEGIDWGLKFTHMIVKSETTLRA